MGRFINNLIAGTLLVGGMLAIMSVRFVLDTIIAIDYFRKLEAERKSK